MDKKFETLIIGLGKTGYACAKYLSKKSIPFAVNDTRDIPPMLEVVKNQFKNIYLSMGKLDQELILTAKQILLSPGVSIREPEIQTAIHAGIEVIGDIELFCRIVNAPIISVTGSNGKSTVTTLIGEMIRAAGKKVLLGGNIGAPVLELLDLETPDYFVLELSSFQLETTTSLKSVAAVILNISEDHMDRYSNIQEYSLAKQKIFTGADIKVINLDDHLVSGMLDISNDDLTYSLNEPVLNEFGIKNIENRIWLVKGNRKLIPIDELKIHGEHNISNSLAALALADAINLPLKSTLNVLRTFEGLPHRCQWIARINNIDWYNDSKGTNVGATCAAIKGLADNKNIVLIAGGESKGADFTQLVKVVENNVHDVILFGKDKLKMNNAFSTNTFVHLVNDLDEAVNVAQKISNSGDIVLFSPACSSLDMFQDYQARGDTFISAVNRIK